MKLNDLKPVPGSKKSRKRVARGPGSGRGKTAGRGHKGQKSRSGFSKSGGWEGGHSRLIMRLPKRGFNRYRRPIQIVNLDDLNRFEAGTTITRTLLVEHGLVRRSDEPVKLLGEGDLDVSDLVIELDAWSAAAAAAVTALGGRVPQDEANAETAEDAAEAAAEEAGEATETPTADPEDEEPA